MMLGRSIDHASLKAYSFSLMAESLLRHDKVSDANRRLARQLHDDAWQMLADDFKDQDQSEVGWMYPSTIAALLLQRTAELAPEQLPYRIWQAIALRRPMEKSGAYQMAGEGCACELALVLAEVDRGRAEQVASWLPSPTSGTTQFMSFVDYSRPAAELLAELHPDQCEATLDAIEDPASNERLRTALISALVRTGDTRHRAIRQNLLLWFPDDEDMGPID